MAEAESGQSLGAADTSAPTTASLWSRRDFFGRLGWGGFTLISLAGLLAAVRSAFPRVLFKPDTTFKAGPFSDFVIGEVSEKFKSDYRVWIVRQPEGFYALYAKCTHLGCTPRWLKAEAKFKCPCHGSGFYMSGINFEGPAPRPLERVRVSRSEDGQLVVDVGVKYRQENGDWDKPGAFLRV
jgi:cytochrome b6-f complex iron-sulfur subunit